MEQVMNGIATIARKSKAGDLVEWVAQAMCDDVTRIESMMTLHVEESTDDEQSHIIVATDGRRLHFASIHWDLVAPGNYKFSTTKDAIILTPVNDGPEFPNWARVIPETTETTTFIAQTWTKKDGYGASNYICNLVRETGANFNFQYLFNLGWKKEAIHYTVSMAADTHDESTTKWASQHNGRPYTKAVVFTADDRTAVIMPMQRD